MVSANDYYIISTNGVVENINTGRTIKVKIGTNGYPDVQLMKDGKRKDFRLHRLVLEAFVSPRPPGMECRHLDGNRLNYSLDNLKWDTRSENMRNKTGHGTTNKGSKHWKAKLNEKQVIEIQELLKMGVSCIEIAKRFNVSRQCVSNIKFNRIWKHL